MMHDPKANELISVVMATYNGARYLPEQLDSVLQQTYQPFEIVITDDGSTDDTRRILEEYASRYPQIRIHFNEQNLGYIKNFEKAVQLAAGKYISLCDQDDYWFPNKLEKLHAAIGDASMIYADSLLCDEHLKPTGKKISDVTAVQPFDSCLQQAVFCRVYGHATLIDAALIKRAVPFPTVLPHDWWLSFMATTAEGIRYFPEALVSYRQHSNNVFGAVGGKKRKEDPALRKMKQQRELEDIRSRVNIFAAVCPEHRAAEKKVLESLADCYQDFSFINNIRRVILFLRYRDCFLAVKKRSGFRKILFCLKMFVKIK